MKPGTRVLVTPLDEPGTFDALMAAIQAEPHLTPEDVADLEAALEPGKKPPSPGFLFVEDAEEVEEK